MLISIHPALVVIDMQNAFCDPNGSLGQLGYDVLPLREPIMPIRKVVDEARVLGVPVIFTRSVFRPNYEDGGIVVHELFPDTKKIGGAKSGTWDAAIIDDLAPRVDEIVVDKTRYSGFYHTYLEDVLRQLRVDTILLCGVTTTACVESTARDGCFRDFRVCVISDATAEVDRHLHEAALKVIDLWFGYTVGSAEAVEILRTRRFQPKNFITKK